MSETKDTPTPQDATVSVRVLAVRLTDDVRAQLDVLAALNKRSVTEEIRVALDDWLQKSRTDPALTARARAVRADIDGEADARRRAVDTEAQTRRNAIDAFFAAQASGPIRQAKRISEGGK